MSITRVFRRRPGERPPSSNNATLIEVSPMLRPSSTGDLGFDARALFIRRFSIIKKALECHRGQGVLILAFDESKVALGEAWIAASLDRTRAAIIGRHSMCSIPVAIEHEAVSL